MYNKKKQKIDNRSQFYYYNYIFCILKNNTNNSYDHNSETIKYKYIYRNK